MALHLFRFLVRFIIAFLLALIDSQVPFFVVVLEKNELGMSMGCMHEFFYPYSFVVNLCGRFVGIGVADKRHLS